MPNLSTKTFSTLQSTQGEGGLLAVSEKQLGIMSLVMQEDTGYIPPRDKPEMTAASGDQEYRLRRLQTWYPSLDVPAGDVSLHDQIQLLTAPDKTLSTSPPGGESYRSIATRIVQARRDLHDLQNQGDFLFDFNMLKCKYMGMPDEELERLRRNGIEISQEAASQVLESRKEAESRKSGPSQGATSALTSTEATEGGAVAE